MVCDLCCANRNWVVLYMPTWAHCGHAVFYNIRGIKLKVSLTWTMAAVHLN